MAIPTTALFALAASLVGSNDEGAIQLAAEMLGEVIGEPSVGNIANSVGALAQQPPASPLGLNSIVQGGRPDIPGTTPNTPGSTTQRAPGTTPPGGGGGIEDEGPDLGAVLRALQASQGKQPIIAAPRAINLGKGNPGSDNLAATIAALAGTPAGANRIPSLRDLIGGV